MTFTRFIARLPDRPGVYRFFGADGNLLYIGKAKALKKRVQSYFRENAFLDASKQRMVKRIASIETTLTANEAEALFLEATLIKKHKPPFNILLRDDKKFAYIHITLDEEFPTAELSRGIRSSKGRYFGPYLSSRSVRGTLKLLKHLFRFRACQPHRGRPCFDYHLGRCAGPCDDRIAPAEYHATVVAPIIRFLQGDTRTVIKDLRSQMQAAAYKRQFEFAGRLRDRIRDVERIAERQAVVGSRREHHDIASIASHRTWAAVNLFLVRNGTLIDQRRFMVMKPEETSEPEALGGFLEQFYALSAERPKNVLTSIDIPNAAILSSLLHMVVKRAQRGKKRRLATTGTENARMWLEDQLAKQLDDENKARRALEGLMKAVGLSKRPKRIECFDISNIHGKHAVGSMVVFENGRPEKSKYRKFTIRSKTRPDDPSMMAEVVARRMAHSEWRMADLIILDGGKGQLSIVRHALRARKDVPPMVALAKREEEIFLPNRSSPILLPQNNDALFLLQRIRDEAHRFAITFYRTKHRKEIIQKAKFKM